LALSARINFDLAVASFLALIRAGEQSAAQAFARIMSRLSRHSFAGLLETRAPHLETLGIDSSLLIQSIDRDRSPD
jgi:hypothetical protein